MDIFLSGWPPGAPPVVRVAADISSAVETLAEGEGAVVVGFPDAAGLEFALEMADLYRHRRFFLAVEPEALSDVSLWRRATGKGMMLVSASNAAEEVAAALPGAGAPRREPEPAEVIARVGKEMASSDNRVKRANKLSIACWSTRGGVGKTALAVNLAVSLALWGQNVSPVYKVCLVDGDAEGGNLRLWLGCPEPRVTLPAWLDLDEDGKVVWNTVQEYLMCHSESGLYYLPRSSRASDAAFVTPELMEKTYRVLTRHFDAVIYDLDPSVRKSSLDILSRVGTILVVSRPDLPTVESIGDDIRDLAPEHGLDLSKMRLVINRLSKTSEFKSDKVAQRVHVPLIVPPLPEDHRVEQAVNHGRPPALVYPDSDFSRAVTGIARNLVGQEIWSKNELRMGWFKRLACLFKGRAAM
ncbi:hypothetical protein A6M21_07620 [Desulfotomaculum copahuensis]|uniref:CobQ/CobB/MinD/ParA nucleotide binding domain-containing protein n=1 Tax=Desulfotomaculum copahuensis TaxID=1838280 RepID=A0A1B7LG09_9FIRM|nr:hypothetical protein A6M21_07620 [Desulfotomaculum copahuensis]